MAQTGRNNWRNKWRNKWRSASPLYPFYRGLISTNDADGAISPIKWRIVAKALRHFIRPKTSMFSVRKALNGKMDKMAMGVIKESPTCASFAISPEGATR